MPPQEKLPEPQPQVPVGDSGKDGYTNDGFVVDKCDSNQNKLKKVVEEKKESFEFDDLLPYIGEFGLYQKILFLLMIPFAFFVAWVYFTQIFVTITPERHWCWVPELANLTQDERYVLICILND